MSHLNPYNQYQHRASPDLFPSHKESSYPSQANMYPSLGHHQQQASTWISPEPGVYPSLHHTAPSVYDTPGHPLAGNLSISFPTPSPFLPSPHNPPHSRQNHPVNQWRSHTLAPPISHLHSPSVDTRSTSPFSPGSSDGRRVASDSSRGSGKGKRSKRNQDPDGLRPERYKGRVGGPPKAKLGGPGGKTYEEMEASKAAAASLASQHQEMRAVTGDSMETSAGVLAQTSAENPRKWHGKPIGIKPPPNGDMPHWPRRTVATTPAEIPLPPSPELRPLNPRNGGSAKDGREVRSSASKDVTIGLPDQSGWQKLQSMSEKMSTDVVGFGEAAQIPLPASDEDLSPVGKAPGSKRGSVDLLRVGAIREPPVQSTRRMSDDIRITPPKAKSSVPSTNSPLSPDSSVESGGSKLQRKSAFIGNAAFLRKQLGGVLRTEGSTAPERHARASSWEGARRILIEADVKPSAVSQRSVDVEVGGNLSNDGDHVLTLLERREELVEVPLTASTDATNEGLVKSENQVDGASDGGEVSPSKGGGGESPVTRAVRLIQSSLGQTRPTPTQNAKRKQSAVVEDPVNTSITIPIESPEKGSSSASRIDRASIGPKMGRYLQGQLTGFLKPKGQRSKLSSSPGTMLHGLDPFTMSETAQVGAAITSDLGECSAASAQKGEIDIPIANARDDEENGISTMGESALGLFTFTSPLRPTAGTFKPRGAATIDITSAAQKPSLRPTAPVFAPAGPRQPRRDSIESSGGRHKRLRGDAPTYNPSSSGNTSRQSFASMSLSLSPIKPEVISPIKSDSPLRLRPSAAAFVPSHIAQASQSLPTPTVLPPLWVPEGDNVADNAAHLEDIAREYDRRPNTQEPGDILIASKALRAEATSFIPSELPLSPTSGKRTLSSTTLKALESWLEKASTGTQTPAPGSAGGSLVVSPTTVDGHPLSLTQDRQDHEVDYPTIGTESVRFTAPTPLHFDRSVRRSAAPSPDSRSARTTQPFASSDPSGVTGQLFYDPPAESQSTVSDAEALDEDIRVDAASTATRPSTPFMISNTPSNADTTIYATVNVSPLTPRTPSRHFTPTKTSLAPHRQEDQILVSSPPASDLPLATAPAISPASSNAPTFRQPEVKVDDAADDQRFRKWVFPNSPSGGERPPTLRRHTMPVDVRDLDGPPSAQHSEELDSDIARSRDTRPVKQRPSIPFTESYPNEEIVVKLDELKTQIDRVHRDVTSTASLNPGVEQLKAIFKDMRGAILSAVHSGDHSRALEHIFTAIQEQSASLTTLQNMSTAVAEVHADLWTIDAAHKTALAELSAAQEQAIGTVTSTSAHAASQSSALLVKLIDIQSAQESQADSMRTFLAAQPAIVDLQERIRILGENLVSAEAKVSGSQSKIDLDEKQHRVVESKLSALRARFESAEEKEKIMQRDFEDVLAKKMAAERARDELAEAMAGSMDTMREQREELIRLSRELEEERARPPPAPARDVNAERMEAMQAASESLRKELGSQFADLSKRLEEESRIKDAERDHLFTQNQALIAQVVTLRSELEASRAEHHAAEATAKSAAASAKTEIEVLRSQLDAEKSARLAAENRAEDAHQRQEQLSDQLLDSRMIARDRQAACRMNEVRLQALAQETHYWRHFALSYDRKEYRAFMDQNPGLLKKSNVSNQANGTSPELKTPAVAVLHASSKNPLETPTKRSLTPVVETPSLVHSSDSSLDL